MPLPVAQPQIEDRAALQIESADRVFDAPRLIALWHLASFDAPSVAVAWSLGFAWVARIQYSWQVAVVLALTTWWIYASDRLLDARTGLRLRDSARLQERHYFHWRHRRVLAPLAVAAGCACATIAFVFLPPLVRERGSILAVASFAYFSGVHARHEAPGISALFPPPLLSKEFLVGVLFASGCILPAWSRFPGAATAESSLWQLWIPGIYFGILVWLNCSCIAGWESTTAQFGTPQSAVSTDRAPFAIVAAAGLVACAGLLLAVLAPGSEFRSGALLSAGAVSALLLGLLDCARPRMTALALRAAADLAMLTPLVLLLR